MIWETAGLEQEEEQDDDRKKPEKRMEDLETPAPKRQKLSQNDIRRFLTETGIRLVEPPNKTEVEMQQLLSQPKPVVLVKPPPDQKPR